MGEERNKYPVQENSNICNIYINFSQRDGTLIPCYFKVGYA